MPRSRTLEKLAIYTLLGLSMTGCARESTLCKTNNIFKKTQALLEKILPAPLPRAYAHNDYLHETPLLNALDNGFAAVEADIHLGEDGKLYVAHLPTGMRKGRTLESLYLEPLRKLIEENKGSVYPHSTESLILMIDVKSGGIAVHQALQKVLEKYETILTTFDNGTTENKAVTVWISGNKPPKAFIVAQKRHCAAYDGRFTDVKADFQDALTPIISGNWNSFIAWKGIGPIPLKDRLKLEMLVETAHEHGKKVRFWDTPEKDPVARIAVWKELVRVNADFISTDRLSNLNAFLSSDDAQANRQVANKKIDLALLP